MYWVGWYLKLDKARFFAINFVICENVFVFCLFPIAKRTICICCCCVAYSPISGFFQNILLLLYFVFAHLTQCLLFCGSPFNNRKEKQKRFNKNKNTQKEEKDFLSVIDVAAADIYGYTNKQIQCLTHNHSPSSVIESNGIFFQKIALSFLLLVVVIFEVKDWKFAS